MTKKYFFLWIPLQATLPALSYALSNLPVDFRHGHAVWFSCSQISILLLPHSWSHSGLTITKVELVPPTTRSAILYLDDTRRWPSQKHSASCKIFQICCWVNYATTGIASLCKWSIRLPTAASLSFSPVPPCCLLVIDAGNCRVWMLQVSVWHFFFLFRLSPQPNVSLFFTQSVHWAFAFLRACLVYPSPLASRAPARYSPCWSKNWVSQVRRSFGRSFPVFLFITRQAQSQERGTLPAHRLLSPHPGPRVFVPTSPLERCLGPHPSLHPCSSGATPGPGAGPSSSASAPPGEPSLVLSGCLPPRMQPGLIPLPGVSVVACTGNADKACAQTEQ